MGVYYSRGGIVVLSVWRKKKKKKNEINRKKIPTAREGGDFGFKRRNYYTISEMCIFLK
jgi:hypothetical protein